MHSSARRVLSVALLIAFASLGGQALAQRKDELKAAIAARRPALEAAKSAGKIGETFRGYVESVRQEADAALKSLLEQENADRLETYQEIAQRNGVTVNDVAARAAARHFQNARTGDYLKHADGQWRRKG